MKTIKYLGITLWVIFYNILFSQNIEKYIIPQELTEKEKQELLSLPDLELKSGYKSPLPYKVDHSETVHFRPVFVQSGMSCGQASSTGMCFTYEMNAARNLPANTNQNLYPTGFVYNWAAGDWGSNGVSYYHTFEVLRMVGTPNQQEYGGTIDYGGNYRWMTDYDLYYSAMHNRIKNAYKINVGTASGLQLLKQWIYDHARGDDKGGCAVFYSTVPYPDAILPLGTEEGGKKVITNLTASTSHAMTILGFNDSIRYDYNGDGQYTNNIDITGDGIVNMRDWEIGGIKMCNTYSGGPSWADGGFCYIMYKAIAGGAFWNNLVNVMEVHPDYEPQLTAKAQITYTNRKRIKVIAGLSKDINANFPEYILDFPIFDYQGGDRYMTGGTNETDKTIEFGLDLTPLLNYIEDNQAVKFFIVVSENDVDYWGNGTLNNFTIINYSSGTPVYYNSNDPVQNIPNNGMAIMTVTTTPTHSKPQITTDVLPQSPINSYYSHQLTASGGTQPYSWSFDNEYEVAENIETFPSGGSTISTTGFTAVPLGFNFKFYGETFNTIYVKQNGLVVFTNGFSESLPYGYNNEQIIFMHSKCIAPFYIYTLTSNVKTISGTNFKTIIWESSKLNFAMTLYHDGRIVLQYSNENLTVQDRFICGISNGDEILFQRLSFPDPLNIPNGYTFTLTPYYPPSDFSVSETGLLTGTPTQQYVNEQFKIKIKDNNGLTNKKTLIFTTDGLILSPIVTTQDDNIIEYNENVNVNLQITNPMVNSCTGISITMSSTDSYINIIDNFENAPNINSGHSINLNNAFSFHVSSNVPNNHLFQLEFNVTTNQGSWNYIFNFTAYAPLIQLGNVTYTDGNNNIPTAGENVQFIVPIKNLGQANVSNLIVTASTSDPYLLIPTTPFNISGLEPGHTENAIFNSSIAELVPSTHDANVQINIQADNNFVTNLNTSFRIYMPQLQVVSFFVNDGNNNCLDPGETSDVIFNIKNNGLVNATNITAALISSNPLININTPPQTLSALSSGSNTLITFNISVDSECDLAELITLTLHVNADYGYQEDILVNMIIGILQETFETGDLSSFEWINDLNYPWIVVTENPYEGTYCLKSGTISHNQQSVLQIQLTVLADGEISFAKKVSSENYYDFLEFLVDGVVVANWSGEEPWSLYSRNITAGEHTFTWRYRKDGSISSGSDAAWIDNITFPAIDNLPPLLWCETTNINKTMQPNEIDIDNLTIENQGGGLINFNIEIIPIDYGKKNIAGSFITANIDTFYPGETMNVMFSATCISPDLEWIKRIVIDFPDEITVNSSSNFVGPSGILYSNNNTGSGSVIEFSTTQTWGVIHQNETASANINLSFDPLFTGNNSVINYTIYGDVYGAEPHVVNGQIVLINPQPFWLTVSPTEGSLPYLSSTDVNLIYNTENLTTGTYYAEIKIYDNVSTINIPVQLNVEIISSIAETYTLTNNLYPNPFNNYFSIELNSDNEEKADFTIYDLSGKKIIYKKDFIKLVKGENSYKINGLNNLSEGIYFIQIKNSNFSKIFKAIKQ